MPNSWQNHQLSWSLLLIGSAFLHLFPRLDRMLTLSLGCHLISGVIEDLVQHLSMERFQEAEWSILIIETFGGYPRSASRKWPNESLIRRLIILVMYFTFGSVLLLSDCCCGQRLPHPCKAIFDFRIVLGYVHQQPVEQALLKNSMPKVWLTSPCWLVVQLYPKYRGKTDCVLCRD